MEYSSGGILKYILILALLLTSCAPKMSYDTTEKALLATAIGGQILDGGSTLQKLDDGCVEANPLLGSYPDEGVILVTKLAVSLVIWQTSNFLTDRTSRKMWLTGMTFLGVAAGVHNWNTKCY